MANGRGSNHQRAIRNRLTYRFKLFRAGEHRRCANRGTRAFKCHIVGIHHSQMLKSEVAHGTGSRANVEWIARVHQDNAQAIEFGRHRQAACILRQPRSKSVRSHFTAASLASALPWISRLIIQM